MNDETDNQFVEILTRVQNRVYVRIYSIVPDPAMAEDILQSTNMALWKKREEFLVDPDVSLSEASFVRWAFSFAHYEILAYQRRMARDRLIFDERVMEQLAERLEVRAETIDERRIALHRCLQKLPDQQRQLIERRYQAGGSVKDLAEALGRTTASVSQSLYRIRVTLLKCIEKSMNPEGL